MTGANILSDDAGAVIDVAISGIPIEDVVATWKKHAREALDALGWTTERIHYRVFDGGASLAISGPIDALYAGTEITEWAWEATKGSLAGNPIALANSIERLRTEIDNELNPAVQEMLKAAAQHDVLFLWDDDFVSVGMGKGSLTWPVDAIPDPADVPWKDIHDIPCAMVTGSNGKTTTVRMLSAIASACGYATGHTCTDGIFVENQLVEGGDYSGPGGARKLVRDQKISFAILETARGGMLRRGLGVPYADAAIVTNVCEDHLGEWGANSIADLVEAKIVIRRAVTDGALVINADDTELARVSGRLTQPITWLSLDSDSDKIKEHVSTGGSAAVVSNGNCVFIHQGQREDIIEVKRIPATVDGHARHNIYNALGAIALARSMGLPADGIRQALSTFGTDVFANRGRMNFFDLGGVRVLIDFAHNPHGVSAIAEMARSIPSERIMVMVGQAGDRDDVSIRKLAGVFASMNPDLVVVKEMMKYLRGRPEGEVTAIITEELRRCEIDAERIVHANSEIDAVRYGLQWSRAGDFLVLPVLQERDEILEFVGALDESGWRPGSTLPA